MPENNASLPLVETAVSPDTAVSPAVAAVLEKAHAGATDVLERFVADETNPIRYYLREANATIACILGRQTNPADFSQIIALKQQYRKAANDANYEAEKLQA